MKKWWYVLTAVCMLSLVYHVTVLAGVLNGTPLEWTFGRQVSAVVDRILILAMVGWSSILWANEEE